jgi:hypothetical protein
MVFLHALLNNEINLPSKLISLLVLELCPGQSSKYKININKRAITPK